MSGCFREVLPDVWEWSETLPDVRKWSGGPSGCPGMVPWPSRISGCGREALPDVWEW